MDSLLTHRSPTPTHVLDVRLQRFTYRRSGTEHRFLLEASLVGSNEFLHGSILVNTVRMKKTENVSRLRSVPTFSE